MWTPKPERASQTNMARFMGLAGKRSYDELHAWSVAERGAFWNLLWEFCEVKGQKGARALVDGDRMPGALWFPDARQNSHSRDRKSTRLNSSHGYISYAVFCLKKKDGAIKLRHP